MLMTVLGLLSFFVFLFSSSHFLVVLLMVELLVLLVFYSVVSGGSSWFMGLMFLLVAVCMGAFGVCALVSTSRSKSAMYVLSFYL